MKSRFFSFSLMVILYSLAANPMAAQSCSAPARVDKASLIGEWEGSFTYNNEILPLQINLADKNKAKQMRAFTQIDALNIPRTEMEAWICKSGELHMRVDLADNRVLKMIGTPDNGKIVGRVVYYGTDGQIAAREVFTMAHNTTSLFK
ncbi:MAG: hypothetical protein KTR30_12345 [Saprospiraceae bacterium]|nr:hypothetical protein [Saprospiraceae bacterium]